MMHHIDLSHVLRQTLECDLYSNLVTRPTGAAVRGQIEELLREPSESARALAVIDFSHVSMIDLSCADEVVAKLLLRYAADDSPTQAYFLLRGVSELHEDAIEAVLERHELVAALEHEDGVRLFRPKPLRAFCRCSPERILNLLRSFPASERVDMVEPDGKIRVTCEYCSRVYDVAPETVDQ